jgi:hypothetical protein
MIAREIMKYNISFAIDSKISKKKRSFIMNTKERLLNEWHDMKWFIGIVFVSLLFLVKFAYVG